MRMKLIGIAILLSITGSNLAHACIKSEGWTQEGYQTFTVSTFGHGFSIKLNGRTEDLGAIKSEICSRLSEMGNLINGCQSSYNKYGRLLRRMSGAATDKITVMGTFDQVVDDSNESIVFKNELNYRLQELSSRFSEISEFRTTELAIAEYSESAYVSSRSTCR